MTLEVRVPGANPTTLFIAGFWGIAAAFAAAFAVGYFWPRVMGRPRWTVRGAGGAGG